MNGYIGLIIIIILISLCETLGQSCLKFFDKNNHRFEFYLLGIIFYALVCFLLVMSYKYRGMGIINVLWSGISILLIMSSGIIFFGEKITTMDKIGIILIISGIVFILSEGMHSINE
jgi:multidrug transporter EmrE-like cation transporter